MKPPGAANSTDVEPSLVDALRSAVGQANVLTEPIDLATYAFDGTAALAQLPGAVAFPANTQECAACVQAAARFGAPIVPRGSGTGLSGGSVPSPGSLVLCLNRIAHIDPIDNANLTVRVGAGAVTQRVDEAAALHGLFYPPDPGSQKISTIGGNIAENSGGLRGLKYGVTRDYVMGLRVVLPDGAIAWLGNQCVKDVAGYNLRDLFIGSEGTLGVVTEALLKLIPRPRARRTLLAVFATMESAAQSVSDVIAAHITPCTLEFLDRKTLECVEAYAKIGLPTDAGAVVLAEADGHPLQVEEEAALMERTFRAAGALRVEAARDEAEADRLRTARRSAFSALARVRPTTILEDVTVPRSRLAEMVAFITQVTDERRLLVGVFGHLGDGNLHPTFLTDERDAEEMHRVDDALEAIVHKTLELGGTITGEHGVGIAKRKFLRGQLGDSSYGLLELVKRAIDPRGLMNPGKIFEPSP